MSIFGVGFSFAKGWLYSLTLLAFFPFIFAISILITVTVQKGFMSNMKEYAQSAGYAEQALNAIRVVQAFGQEKLEKLNYEKYLGKAKQSGIKSNLKAAAVVGAFFSIIFFFYSYSFYIRAIFIT